MHNIEREKNYADLVELTVRGGGGGSFLFGSLTLTRTSHTVILQINYCWVKYKHDCWFSDFLNANSWLCFYRSTLSLTVKVVTGMRHSEKNMRQWHRLTNNLKLWLGVKYWFMPSPACPNPQLWGSTSDWLLCVRVIYEWFVLKCVAGVLRISIKQQLCEWNGWSEGM